MSRHIGNLLWANPTFRSAARIGVDKSAYHQRSHYEIDGGNPCYRHLSGNASNFQILFRGALNTD